MPLIWAEFPNVLVRQSMTLMQEWDMFGRKTVSGDAVLELQRQLVELRGQLDDLASKHERLRGAFYQARQGLAADGETPIHAQRARRAQNGSARPETREEFKARMQGKPIPSPHPSDEERN